MNSRSYPATTGQQVEHRWRFGVIDLVLIVAVFAVLRTVVMLGGDMRAQFDELHPPQLSLDIALIPYYAARTVLRMFIAFGASLMFTLGWGYAAAKSARARIVMLPLIDILQSVPVLGFLSVTVTGFIALFPGSLLGVECASIFAIFTAQAWNMTFGFYHSMVTVPSDLQEAATAYQLGRWQRFVNVELPSSAIGLVWNSMMSFGGGWFFVAQSEAITVLNKNIKLPGLGAYMATAVEQGDARAALYAIAAMIATIVVIDQLFWRPLVAWVEKFKFEQTGGGQGPTSWMLDLLRRSYLVQEVSARFDRRGRRRARPVQAEAGVDGKADPHRRMGRSHDCGRLIAIAAIGIGREIHTELSWGEMLRIFGLGVLTLLRVAAMTALGTQWYILFNVIAGTMSIPTDLREASLGFAVCSVALMVQASPCCREPHRDGSRTARDSASSRCMSATRNGATAPASTAARTAQPGSRS